jgi:hypothetical protein
LRVKDGDPPSLTFMGRINREAVRGGEVWSEIAALRA